MLGVVNYVRFFLRALVIVALLQWGDLQIVNGQNIKIDGAGRVSFNEENIRIDSLIYWVGAAIGISNFVFSEDPALKKRIKKSCKNVPGKKVLRDLVESMGLKARITQTTFNIIKRGKERAAIAPFTFRGKVVNNKNEGICGVSISMNNNKYKVVTNESGSFKLNEVQINDMLTISCVGQETKNIRVLDSNMLIALQQSTSMLKEALANGTAPGIKNTDSALVLKASLMDRSPKKNGTDLLQGRIPGLFILHKGGMPGTPVSILIRGRKSLMNGTLPWVMFDGIPLNIQMQNGMGSDHWPAFMSTIDLLEFSDVEKIEVFKDAEATAVYGSPAVNGVISLTPKAGIAGPPVWEASLAVGIGDVPQRLPLMNTAQYLGMRREAMKNDGVVPTDKRAPDLLLWDTTKYTNWQDMLIGGRACYQQAGISFSGGWPAFKYMLSADYNRNTTVFPTAGPTEKGGFFASIKAGSPDKRLQGSVTGLCYMFNTKLPAQDLTADNTMPPNAPSMYLGDGSFNYANGTWNHPLIKPSFKGNLCNTLLSTALSYNFPQYVKFSLRLGFNNQVANSGVLNRMSLWPPGWRENISGSSWHYRQSVLSWIAAPAVTFVMPLDSNLIFSTGITLNGIDRSWRVVHAEGFTDDTKIENNRYADSVFITRTSDHYRYTGFYLSSGYNYAGKYLFWLHGRVDGSSRFAKGQRHAFFGTFTTGWAFYKEEFVKSAITWLNYGKLRFSAGTSGNDQVNNYQYLNVYEYSGAYQGTNGQESAGAADKHFSWEHVFKRSAGIDLRFLQNGLSLSLDYYHEQSTDQLGVRNLPAITGTPNALENLKAKVINKGWECVLGANIRRKYFEWSTLLNFTISRNKLVSFSDISGNSIASPLGHPLSNIFVYKFEGVDAAKGSYLFSDINRKPSAPNSMPARIVSVNTDPQIFGGFDNVFRYKNYELSIFVQFVKQKGILYNASAIYGAGFMRNQPVGMLQRWQKPGDISSVQKFSQNASVRKEQLMWNESDQQYGDASYLRLNQLSISRQLKCRYFNVTFSLKASNLITISRYKGLDPETQSAVVLPPGRVLMLGAKLSL
jgi:TonB-linked SusC/RagA family outer membrane protein